MSHKHKQLMEILAHQILDGVENPGELWEFKYPNAEQWTECLSDSLPCFHENMDFRLKQKTININGYKVPEPERVAPRYGDKYFKPSDYNKKGYACHVWCNDQDDFRALENGVVHLTPEAAITHGKAIYSFTRNTIADAE